MAQNNTIRVLQEELEKERAILKSAKDRIAMQNAELERLRREAGKGESPDALEDANARIAGLISNLQSGVLSVDENGRIVFVNEAFCRLFGISVVTESLIATDGTRIMGHIKQLFKNPHEFTAGIELILIARKPVTNDELRLTNGHILSRDYIPVYSNGVYKGHIWKFTDVTRTKTIGDTFETQRNFYEQILNSIPADIVVFSADQKYLFVNPVAVSKPELRKWMIGKTHAEYCEYTNKPTDIADARDAAFRRVLLSKSSTEWEERYVNPEGVVSYHVRIMFPVCDSAGDVDFVIAYGVNITERKKIEEQIKVSEKRYRDIFNFSQAWIGTHDRVGRILSLNPAACRILGYGLEELTGQYLESLIPEKVRHEFTSVYLKKIFAEGRADGIMSVLNKNGKTIYLLYHNFLVAEPGSEPYIIGFAQDVTQRIHAEEALRESEERYKGIIENMNLGMIEIDADEFITYANQRFCAMSGYEPHELMGKKATDLFLRGASLRKTRDELQKGNFAVNNGYELAVKTKNGEDKWWFTSATVVYNPDGTPRGTISIHLDITGQKKLEEQLRLAKRDTERSSQSKDAFLTNMSHEIRTPLNAIMGLGKLLSKSELNADQKNYLNGIEGASANLLSIINDLLDISKIEAGKITLEEISFNLQSVAQQALNVLEHKAEEKGLKMGMQVDDRIAPVLIGDPFRINQVLMNMLGNAIKFTEKGFVNLTATWQGEQDGVQQVLVRIQDTGVGIKDEYLKVIFDKFTQEDETVVRKFGGTGLGMSITRQLMELMGGSIKVESQKNVGTTILLTFNFKVGTARVFEKKRTIKNETGNISGRKILVVEDNGLNRLLAYTILTDYGAVVSEAENGKQAVEMMRKDKYDIVLMDIQMPVMDGIQATKIIREQISRTVPIIALTANAIKGKEHFFTEAGMNDYIFKPYTEINLVNPIAKWLEKAPEAVPAATPTATLRPAAAALAPQSSTSEQPRARVAPTAAPPSEQLSGTGAAPASGPLYDLAKLKALARNDTGFVVKMLRLFIDETPPVVEKIKECHRKGDFASVRHYAHRIKPSLNNLAITSLMEDILKIEFIKDNDPAAKPLIQKLDTVIAAVVKQLKAEYKIE